MKTEWTAPDALYSNLSEFPAANRFLFNGLEELLNWQSSISFAEEGKNKVVLSYHDGSGRARQAITRVNTDQRAIIGETLYDFNGRPVIQTLPVPVTNNYISYVPNFNIIEGKSQLDKADFDKGASGAACATVSPVFSTGMGASQYYSPNNPFGSNGNAGTNLVNRSLIPDAGKYPYTQTVYKSDNTGRILAQSGVGSAYRIGSGKETKYFYGAPQQEELSRLFGSQVGYAGHYKKNAVVDPNGQTSVSYLDLEGRVVATALAGPPPPNVSGLAGSNLRTIKSNLLSSGSVVNQITADKISKVFNTNIVVVNPNTVYNFNYNAAVGTYSLNCLNSQAQNPINYSLAGVVDIEFVLKDNCGVNIFKQNASSLQNFNGGTNQNIVLPQQVTLQAGQYQLSKTITINMDKLNQYWDTYLSNASGTCVLNQRNFIDEEISKINTSGCGITCAQCTSQVNTLLTQNLLLDDSERERLLSSCDKLCSDVDITCKSALDAMKGDLSPGGQYGELRPQKLNMPGTSSVSMDVNNLPKSSDADVTFKKSDGTDSDAGDQSDNQVDPSPFPLSIFNESNSLRINQAIQGSVGGQPSWRRPIAISLSGYGKYNGNNQLLDDPSVNLTQCSYSITDYKDSKGRIYYVNVFVTTSILGDNSSVTIYKPQITDPNQLVLVDQSTGLYKIPVKYLQNIADFEKYWQKEWSYYFIPYHPEYEYLVECSKQKSFNDFDYLLYKTASLEDAQNLGFINAASGFPAILGTSTTNCKDPFVKSTALYYSYMTGKNDIYKSNVTLGGINMDVSMSQMATILVGCPKGQTNCGRPGCLDGKINTDDEWNTFKGLYLGEKQALIRALAQKKAVDGFYYNGCIGNKDFLTSSEADYFQSSSHWWGRTGFYWTSQLCNSGDASLYYNKTARFFPGQPTSPSGKQLGSSCKTLVQNGSDDPITLSVPCTDELDDFTDDVNTDVLLAKYASCGLCPLASDVEQLIMDLRNNNALATINAPGLLLSCQNSNYPVSPGDLLLKEFSAHSLVTTNNPDIYWLTTIDQNGQRLHGTFSNTSIELSLALPIGIPATATFSSITKLCCLSVLGWVDPLNTSLGQIFVMQSAYNVSNVGDVPFLMTGTVNLGLNPCSFPPKCQTTDDANRVAQFLNILTTTVTGGTKVNDLVTNGTDKTLTDPGSLDFYQNAIRTIIKKDNYEVPGGYIQDVSTITSTWNSQIITGTQLQGVFKYFLNGETRSVVININNFPSEYSFSNISKFFRLRPDKNIAQNDPCRTSNCNKQKFLADVVIIQGDSRIIRTVEIEVPAFNPVICKPPIAAGSN